MPLLQYLPWTHSTSVLVFRPSPELLLSMSLILLASVAYGSSQARGWIGASAVSPHYSHSNTSSSHIHDLHHSSWQRWILNPLSEVRNQTLIPTDTSWVHYCWAKRRNPNGAFFISLHCNTFLTSCRVLHSPCFPPTPWVAASKNHLPGSCSLSLSLKFREIWGPPLCTLDSVLGRLLSLLELILLVISAHLMAS